MGTVQLKHGVGVPLVTGGAVAINQNCCCAYCNLVSSVSLTIAGMARDPTVDELCDCESLDSQCAALDAQWILSSYYYGQINACYNPFFPAAPSQGGNCIFAYQIGDPPPGEACVRGFVSNPIVARLSSAVVSGTTYYTWDAWVGTSSGHAPPTSWFCTSCSYWSLGGLTSPLGTFTLAGQQQTNQNGDVCVYPATVTLIAI